VLKNEGSLLLNLVGCNKIQSLIARIIDACRRSAPRAELRHYDADRFSDYHPPTVTQIITDQIRFLTTHLRPGRVRRGNSLTCASG
jgi:hypothetical protein